jgi:VWFA-related protein
VNRRIVVAASVLLAWIATPGVFAVRAQQPAFRARTDVVSVNVSVMKGREPVTGLTTDDFTVTDNGMRQTLDAVSLEHVPIDMTILLTGQSANRTAEQGRSLVSADSTRTLLRPEDRLRIVWTNDDISGGLVGADYTVQTDPRQKEIAAGIAMPQGFATGGREGKSGLGIALADGLFYALAWPVPPDRRHLVVAFTDGWDTASTLTIDTLPKLAAHSDAVLHAVFWASAEDGGGTGGGVNINIGLPLPSLQVAEWKWSTRMIEAAVERTGGTIQRTRQVAEALAWIIADFRSSYVLRYSPRGVPPAGWHELQVKVTRTGSFTIRARKGYEGG